MFSGRQIRSSLPAALLPEITCAEATIPHGARHGSYHAPVKDTAIVPRPRGPPELKRHCPKTQPLQNQASNAPAIPLTSRAAPCPLPACFTCTKCAVSDTSTQPAAASRPVERLRGQMPKTNPPRQTQHSTRMPPPLAPWRHTGYLEGPVLPKSNSYSLACVVPPWASEPGLPAKRKPGFENPPDSTRNPAAAGNTAPHDMLEGVGTCGSRP